MSERFLRIYKKVNVYDAKKYLAIYGDLSAQCANCQALDIKFGVLQCPQCQTHFKYIAFRNIKQHLPKLQSLSEQHPHLVFVDYDDFSRTLGALKAEDFLK